MHTVLNLRFAVPNDWNPRYSVDDLFQQFLSDNPNVVADELKNAFPNLAEPIVVNTTKQLLGNGERKLGKTRIHINGVYLQSTDRQYLTARLEIEPAIRAEIPWPEVREYQAKLKNLSHQIETAIAKALPEFSKNYLAKTFSVEEKQVSKDIDDCQTKAANARNDLSRFTGLPPEKFAEQLAEISRQQIAAELSLVGMQARDQAINDEIKKTELRLDAKTGSDDTIKNLDRLLQMRIDRLDSLKKLQAAGVAPTQELQSAEADVLSAKIELDKTRAALKRSSGGDQLDALNNELSRLAIDRAETLARRDYLKKISDETEQRLRQSREEEKRAGDARPVLEEAQNQIEMLTHELDRLKENEKNIEPLRLEVVDEPDDSTSPSKPTTATPEKPAATEQKPN